MRILLTMQFAVLSLFLLFLSGRAPLCAQELTPTASSTPSPQVSASPTVEASGNSASAVSLGEVVVTANRLDTPANQVPNSLTVITAQDIENKQSGTVNQALQNVPGLDVVQSGGPGQITSTYMRGGNDGAAQVMMDGIPLNDPTGTGRSYDYLDELTLDGVQQIEVVRGPESVLYGSNAMAGVINIVTHEGAGPAAGSLLFEGGSYGTVHGFASAQGSNATSDYALSTSYFNTAGFPSADKAFGNSLNNPDSDFSGLLRVGAEPVSNLQEEVLVNYNQSRTNLDDGAGSNNVPPPYPVMDDPNSWVDQEQVLAASKTRLTLGDWEQSLTLSFNDNNRYYTDFASAGSPYSFTFADGFDGQTAQATWQNNFKLFPGKTLVFGLQGYREWSSTSAPSATTIDESQWSESGFLEAQVNQDDRLFVNVGGRLDNYNTYGTHGTYQAGAAYFIPGLETKLKATYGTGFSAPTLFELYAPAPNGNPALQPENSIGYDFGLEQPLAGNLVKLGATYFHNDFGNLIIFVGPSTTGQYQNSGSFQTDGVETFLDFKPIQELTLRGFYTYTNVQTSIPATQDNSPLLQKPANQAGADLDFQTGPLEVGATSSYVSARPDYDFYAGEPVTLASYFLMNLRASFQVDNHVKFFARVDNLFNQFYEEVYGYGTPGLSAYAGTKISF